MNKFVIYLHRNKINNKVYIGQTCQKPKDRWKYNGSGYRNQIKFYDAIKKYGWDNFEHLILEENLSQEEASKKERYYIQQYDAINNGYNILPGGSNVAGSNNPMFGKHHSEETKKKISASKQNLSKETHKRMSDSAQKRVLRDGPPFLGKHLSESAKEKLRQVDKSYTQTEEYGHKMSLATAGGKNGAAIKVKATHEKTNKVQYFDCKKDALIFLNLSRSSLKFLNKAIQNHTVYHNYYWEENNE